MTRWIKYSTITILLIGSGFLLGYVFKRIEGSYQLLFAPTWELFELLLWILAVMIAFAVSAGLVAALLRPIWIAIIVCLIASVVFILSWKFTIESGLIGLGLFIGTSIYTLAVQRGLNERIRFSVEPISIAQGILLTTLLLAISGSFYIVSAEQINKQGFVIPDKYMELFTKPMKQQILSNIPAEQREQAEAEFEAQFQSMMDTLYKDRIKPYEKYMPLLITIGIFFTLKTIESFVSWIPTILLQATFALLVSTKFVSELTETKEIQRLVLE